MPDILLINPATGETIGERDYDAPGDIERTLQAAADAFPAWRTTPVADRCAMLAAIGDALETDADRAAASITELMGKPIAQARGEVAKCAALCRDYAEHGPSMVRPRTVPTEARMSEVRLDPLGPILGIMPWNFPYWQVIRWAVPMLTVGNGCVLKHADNVAPIADHIAELVARAGVPGGVFSVLSVGNESASDLIEDRRLRGVSLTGSGRAGRSVAARAGAVLKPSVLELGGSDAAIVLPDCDLDRHLDDLVNARFQNTGQTCVATKRYLVHRDIADEFTERFVNAAIDLPVGDPTDESTRLGPLARADLRDGLHEQVERTVVEGGRLLIGGQQLDDGPHAGGWYYEPTVIDQVRPEMTPFREELFGPAAAIVEGRDEDELVRLANATDYGLAATVWTADLDRADAIADRLQAGCVFVNRTTKSDWRLPFGGIKDSGYGRELGGRGVEALANLKTVWVE